MRRFIKGSIYAVLLIALLAIPVMAAFSSTITVTESSNTDYDKIGVTLDKDVDYLADHGFITTSGRDVRITQGVTELDYMLVEDRINFVLGVSGNTTQTAVITTDNTPKDYQIVPGYEGKITISDDAALELGDNFELECTDTWVDTDVTTARHNHYITGNDADTALFDFWWYAQTFTPMQNMTITSVKFLMYRVGNPGTITVTLRETDASGHPLIVPPASELATGITSGDTLTTNAAGEWREITFTNGYRLTAGVRYAIVFRATSGDAGDRAEVLFDDTVATFPGGNIEASNDSGATWNTMVGDDFMFEVWGTGSEGEKLLINKTNAVTSYVSADGDISVDIWTPTGRWAEVASTINGQTHIFAVEEFNGKLYGSTSGGRLFEWNGTDAWVQVAPLLGGAFNIYDLQVFNGKLYGADASTGVLLEWNGTDAWVDVAIRLNGKNINCLKVFDDGGGDDLYGGTDTDGRLYRWTSPAGPWVQVAAPLVETDIYDLEVYDDGGGDDLYGGTSPNGNLYRFTGAAWVQVAPQLNAQTEIRSLEVYDDGSGDALYGGTGNGGRLFQWNDVNAWVQVAPQFGAETVIYGLANYNGHLYGCTGDFANLVYWDDSAAWVQAASRPDAETQVYQLAEFEDNLFGGSNPNAMLLQFMPDLYTVTVEVSSGEHDIIVGIEER